jgi:pimeloyl-ACP methyl ester carboxylesterase
MATPRQLNCDVKGIKIATYRTGPSRNRVILIHGNSASHKMWRHQFESPAFNNWDLIAIDLPGCGNSETSPDPQRDYNIVGLADVVVGLMRELRIKKPVMVGHSLGGHIVLEVCKLSSGIQGIVIFGAPPMRIPPNPGEAFLPYENMGLFFRPKLSEDEAARLQRDLVFKGNNYPIAEDFLKTDPDFRTFMGSSLAAGRGISNEVEILESLKIPVAILHGKDDPVINLSYLQKLNSRNLWKGRIVTREHCGHYPQLEDPAWFNAQIVAYMRNIGYT